MQTSSGADDLFGPSSGAFGSSGPTASGFGAGVSAQEIQPSLGGGPNESFSGFGGAAESTFEVVRPPVAWLLAALSIAIVALALVSVWISTPPVSMIGWLLGGPVCIGLTAIYLSVDTKKRTRLGYSPRARLLSPLLYGSALTVGFAAVVIAAIELALWAGRGF